MSRRARAGNASEDESQPLLFPRVETASDCHENPPSTQQDKRCSWPWIYFVGVVLAIAVVSDVGETLWVAPRMRLFESVICSDYYRAVDPSLVDGDGSVPEKLCKVDAVQEKLASILGLQFFFDSVPAIILPIPYGYLADKSGRKWILIFSLWGYAASYAWTLLSVGVFHLPLQFVWLSSLFYLIGGGPTTATTLLTTVVADVVPTELRGTVFFYRFCTDLVADLFVPPLTSFLMTRNLWTPLILAMFCQAITGIMYIIVPETLPILEQVDDADNSARPDTSEQTTLTKRLSKWIHSSRESFSFISKSSAIGGLVFTFLISKVGRQSTNVLFQYVSKRYGWTLAQAGLLISLRAAVNIALFTAALPALSGLVLSSWPVAAKDLLLAKCSIVLLALGTFTVFISATPFMMIIGVITFTLGSGFAPTVRSLVTSLVEALDDGAASDIGRLYAVISTMEGIGSLIAAPGMAWALRLGISLGQSWLGLPFGFAAALFTLVSFIVFSISVDST